MSIRLQRKGTKKEIKISTTCIGQNSKYVHICMKGGKILFIYGSVVTVVSRGRIWLRLQLEAGEKLVVSCPMIRPKCWSQTSCDKCCFLYFCFKRYSIPGTYVFLFFWKNVRDWLLHFGFLWVFVLWTRCDILSPSMEDNFFISCFTFLVLKSSWYVIGWDNNKKWQ